MEYVEKTNYQFDLDQLNFEWNHIKDFILTKDQWYLNRTCLQHSKDCVNQYIDGSINHGKRIPRRSRAEIRSFCLINDIYRGTIFEDIINELNVVRSRIMIIDKHRTYSSVHADRTKRSHFVLNTNPYAFFLFPRNPIEKSEIIHIPSEVIHIPADGYVYKVDTRLPHTFVNAGEESRTHLVMCHG